MIKETFIIEKQNIAEVISNMNPPKKTKAIKRNPVYLNVTWGELFGS